MPFVPVTYYSVPFSLILIHYGFRNFSLEGCATARTYHQVIHLVCHQSHKKIAWIALKKGFEKKEDNTSLVTSTTLPAPNPRPRAVHRPLPARSQQPRQTRPCSNHLSPTGAAARAPPEQFLQLT